MPFRRIIRGMSKLSADYTLESYLFLMNISAKLKQTNAKHFPQDNPQKKKTFMQITLWKGMPFHNIFCGKSDMSLDNPAESFSKPSFDW